MKGYPTIDLETLTENSETLLRVLQVICSESLQSDSGWEDNLAECQSKII